MSNSTVVDKIRGNVLDHIERSERNYKLAFYFAFVIEAAFIVGFLLLADFSNRVHVLLLISAMAVYMILASGLFALGAHVSRNTQLVLKAIEMLTDRVSDRRV
ncbi:MAG TPA: hypothetical protein VLD57_01230 [Blastocatellia bacterium]|nr:hypothetical protein [Blastocatellia bacterium]